MNEHEIERLVQAKIQNLPKLDTIFVESLIQQVEYSLLPNGRSTLCQITLNNGLTVEGISPTVFSDYYDTEQGCKNAHQRAMRKVWGMAKTLYAEAIYRNKLEIKELQENKAKGLGMYFQHYSGAIYKLLNVVRNEANYDQEMAVYQSTADGVTFVRPYLEFLEKFTCINQLNGLDQLLMTLQAEYDDVALRYSHLDQFISRGKPETMDLMDWLLLKDQLRPMRGYYEVVMARMQSLSKKKGECYA